MAGTSNNSGAGDSKDKDCRWYFTAEQLANSPSRRHGIDADQELSFRQLTAYLIQEMGQRLQVSQLCINTAIVYMHRFYAFHSFTHFHRNGIAAASLFLAAKVEEQPRKLEHVIKVSHMCLNQEAPHPSTEAYAEEAQGLVFNENVLLQTLGFDVAIDHPHTHVVKTCHLVKACKDLAQTSYFLASNSLHLTSMCLQYGPTVVACFCIYLACKWSRWEIPQSTEGKHWFHYVDKTVTMDLLKKLTDEFIAIYEKSPARLKSKLNSIKALVQGAKIAEPPRNISESSNGSSSQLASIDPPRRPESFSSHHRSHHSSHANASHHHHGKQIPLVESAASEHKPIPTHKQPFPAAALSQSNRAKPERSQVSGESPYIGAQHATSKQPPTIPNNSRTSSSGRASHNAAPSSSSVPQPRVPHGHDVNYHKSRSVVPPQTNPPMPSHKLPVKSAETSRNTVKDSVSRGTEPGKNQAKHSSNMHPPSNAVPEASRNVVPPPSSGLSHQQRAYFPPNSNRTSSSGSNTVKSNSSIKHEQSVQQQAHMHVSQKQSTESSFTSANVRQVEDPSKMGDQMEICSPPKYSSYSPSTTQPATLQSQQSQSLNQPQSKSMSIFSPEWNEKSLHPMTSIPGNIGSSNGSSKPVGYSIKQSKDSPKKIERDRRSDTIKKERGRPSEVPIAETSKMVSSFDRKVAPPPSGMNKRIEFPVSCPSSSTMPFDLKIKQEHPHVHSMGGFKRPATAEMNSRIADDNALREFKLRKLEPQSPPMFMEQKNFPPMYEPTPVSDARIAKSFPATINGIETNPDLVSSLLKESLCNDSKFPGAAMLKTEPKEPDDLSLTDFAVPTETLPQQILQSDVPTKSEIPSNLDELLKSKSEKKKKKEKHKHKEKDKTKDKEEKKKHKKDKDKHKERERDRLSSGAESAEQNPMKIKIYKDKMNLPVVEASHPPPPTGFKIKIPKDRIKGEISNFPLEESSSSLPAPSSIKIKISKDKVETYSQSSQDVGGSGVYINSVNHIHSSSNKKKDKDRDKEKEKRKSGNDPHRHNGSNLTGSNVAIDSMSKPLPSNLHKIWPN